MRHRDFPKPLDWSEKWYIKSVDSWSTKYFIASMDGEREAKHKKNFGERLRAIRKDKGFTQEKLALTCDLDRSYIGGVERGERNISLVNIYKIANALGISPRDFFE